MSRYIDADAFKRNNADLLHCDFPHICEDTLEEIIDCEPTADVAPVVHGEWKGKPIAGYCTVRCSVCGSAFLDNDGRWKYCPNCGAKMDLKEVKE